MVLLLSELILYICSILSELILDICSMLEKEYSQIFAARPLCTSGIQTVFRRVGQHDRETIYIDDIIRLFHHFLRRTLTMYTLTHDTIISGVIVIQYAGGQYMLMTLFIIFPPLVTSPVPTMANILSSYRGSKYD